MGDLRRREEARVIAVLRLDRAAFSGDGDDFGDGADIELEAPEIELAARAQHVVAALDGAEPGELDLDGVGSGIDGPEREVTAIARDRRPGAAGGVVGERDRGARHHLTGIVDEGPRDRAGVLRRGRKGREQRQDGACDPHAYV